MSKRWPKWTDQLEPGEVLCKCGHPRAMHHTPLTWYPWIPLPPEGVCSHITPPGSFSIKAGQEGCGCHGWSPDPDAKPMECAECDREYRRELKRKAK